MAILMKEKIENKALSNERNKQRCFDMFRKDANQLRNEILAIKDECKDIYDTLHYCKKQHIYPNIEQVGFCTEGVGRIVLYQGNLKYTIWSDYQSITFNGYDFTLELVSSFNGRSTDNFIGNIDFSKHNEYYVIHAINVMKGFLDEYPTFKADFMTKLNKALK